MALVPFMLVCNYDGSPVPQKISESPRSIYRKDGIESGAIFNPA